jgi:hypothetical protein
MDFAGLLIKDFSKLLRSHLVELMLVLVGVTLSIYGDDINKSLMKKFKKKNFFIRFAAFVGLCVFGYAFVTIISGEILAKYLSRLNDLWLVSVIVFLFLILGLIAEEKNHI